jgi:membrane-associated protein
MISEAIDFFLHIDKHLAEIISQYQTWTYLLLFIVIFCETGLVVTPFLPGDSLLFAAGALSSSTGVLDIHLLALILACAAVLGDTVNYWIGHFIGPRVFNEKVRFLKREYLERTHKFYEKHGGKTIIIARFVPIVRTFAPFVAGIGAMNYSKFILYNIIGGFAWTYLFVYAGYLFADIPFIKGNFSIIVVAIILISVVPIAVEFLKSKRKKINK